MKIDDRINGWNIAGKILEFILVIFLVIITLLNVFGMSFKETFAYMVLIFTFVAMLISYGVLSILKSIKEMKDEKE